MEEEVTPLRYDVRFSLDERRSTRPSYESVRPSLDYARRGRQSADVSRSKPVNRVSFDVAHRFSLDPALVELGETRAARGPKSVKGPLEGCVLYLHGVKDAELERGAKAAGARIVGAVDAQTTHLITSDECAANPKDDVIKRALKNGLWIVKPAWVPSSHRMRQDELDFGFEPLRHQAAFEDLIHNSIERTTPADLAAVEAYYRDNIKGAPAGSMYTELSKREGKRLLRMLASVLGQKTDSKVRPQLTPLAKRALATFYFFLREDAGFQRAVEELNVTLLAKVLKIERHLEDAEPAHQQLATAVVLFLTGNYPRFAELKVQLRASVRESVDIHRPVVADQVPALQRFSLDGHLPPSGKYYDMDAEAVVALFQTNTETGLTAAEVETRKVKYGPNVLPQEPPVPWWRVLLLQFLDFLMIVLAVVGTIELALQSWIEGAVLWAVVFINAFIGFYQEMKAEAKLNALKNLLVATATVIRDGARQDVVASDLVPGDIVVMQEGTQVPADMRLVEAQQLRVLEAQLTGENEPIKKNTKTLLEPGLKEGDQTNMVFMSTNVNVGDGKGVVVATGAKTAIGLISKNVTSAQPGPTKLQQKLKKLGVVLLVVAVVLCSVILALSFIWLAGRGRCTPLCPGDETKSAIEAAVALAVSVIPEGLVAIFTICMAMGASRMAQRGAIVRHLASVETLGSVTTVCSDKTGTLTVGLMKQEMLWLPGPQSFDVTGVGIDPAGQMVDSFTGHAVDPNHVPRAVEQAMLVGTLCNGSSIAQNPDTKRWTYTGDPTEVAMLVAAYKIGMGQPQMLERGWKILGRAPFDSNRKRMTVLVTHPDREAAGVRGIVLSKGAPEATLRACTRIMTCDGVVQPVADALVHQIDRQAGVMADEGLRVLGFAFAELDAKQLARFNPEDDNTIIFEEDLTFCGLAGLMDPPRAPVRDSVATCHGAGIRVVMITGDHPRTALAIAKRLGIAAPEITEQQVIKGKQLDAMSEEELAAYNPFPTVFARVSPEDKMKIVHALQARREIVSMTGDGVNDAPAIRHADVGVAMGITGTDLTKEAADIVLTNDDFRSIVSAIKEGRRIMDNIILFLIYLLSCNSGEVWTMLLCAVGGLPSAFTSLQILWGNLIPAVDNVLSRLPRDPDQALLTRSAFLILLLQGISLAAWSVTLFTVEYIGFGVVDFPRDSLAYKDGLLKAQAHTFITISCMQLAQAMTGRTVSRSLFRQNFFDNLYLLLGISASFCLLVACMYIPGWNTVFDQYPMDGYDWIVTGGFVVLHLAVVEFLKYCVRHNFFLPKPAVDPSKKLYYSE